jgi:hypothetical protein
MSTVRTSDHDGGVRLLTLDRPPANAIDETLSPICAARSPRPLPTTRFAPSS